MYIMCCDKCGAVFGETCDDGRVLKVTIQVEIDDNMTGCLSPGVNKPYMFCSTKCALEYLKKIEKIEDNWLDTWEKGKILGEKKIIPLEMRKESNEIW